MRADIDGSGSVNLLDLSAVAGAFNEQIPPASARLDQNGDGRINLLDLAINAAAFGGHVSDCS
jgi:hypothetical protein